MEVSVLFGKPGTTKLCEVHSVVAVGWHVVPRVNSIWRTKACCHMEGAFELSFRGRRLQEEDTDQQKVETQSWVWKGQKSCMATEQACWNGRAHG